MTPVQYSKELTEAIDKAIEAFNSKIPEHEKRVYKELVNLLKELKTKNGRILNNIENLKTLMKIKGKLSKIVLDKTYLADVKEFTNAFEQITKLQNNYFASFAVEFTPPKVLALVRAQSIDDAVYHLTKGGTGEALIPKISEILRQNVTASGSYANMIEQVREFVLTTETRGALGYAKCITTDSLNAYSAAYTKGVTDDLQLPWMMYVGSLVKDSREWCIHMVKKRYIYKTDLPELVKGEIDGIQVKLNKKTGLPQGMYPDTDATTVLIVRGGYCCGHQFVPVNELAVPKKLRLETYDRLGIKYNDKGWAIAA